MSRAWRYFARFPSFHIASKLELNCPSIDHNVAMVKPILIPRLAVDLDRLHIVAILVVKVVRSDPEILISINSHVDIGEPRRLDEVDCLGHNWIKAQHLPNEP